SGDSTFLPSSASLTGGLTIYKDPHAPSQIVVTSRFDDNKKGTLRDAIAQANADAKKGISDTIVFDIAQMGTNTLVLTAGQLDLNAAGSGTVTIDGGTQVTLSGNNASRVFQVAAGARAILTGLTITGGFAAGTGGGILNAGILTVANSTIAN